MTRRNLKLAQHGLRATAAYPLLVLFPTLILFVYASQSHAALDVRVANFELVVTSREREKNLVDITVNDFFYYDIVDTRNPVRAGDGCTQRTLHHVRCPALPLLTMVNVDVGPGNDEVGLDELQVRSETQGGAGDDFLVGGGAEDLLQGEDGDDTLVGRDGANGLDGGDGDDRLSGGRGRDTVTAGDGIDYVLAGAGDDVVLGGAGPDLLSGGPGLDELNGQDGADGLFDYDDTGRIDGGPDSDLIRSADDDGGSVDCGFGVDRVMAPDTQRTVGCDVAVTGLDFPTTWPPPGSGATAPSAQAAACGTYVPCSVDVDVRRPHGSRAYFTVEVKGDPSFGTLGVRFRGTRKGVPVQRRIKKVPWPSKGAKRVRPERPSKRATDGNGRVLFP